MGKFWKYLFALIGIDLISGNTIFDGSKGRIGCGWVWIFTIIFFPLWLVVKLLMLPFRLMFKKKR